MILKLGNGLLGYATFPPNSTLSGLSSTGTSTTDGVVVLYNAFGRVGSLISGYDLGRTATHEVGHYLGLRHISGDSPCATDYCMDTPAQTGGFAGGGGGLNWGCPSHPFQAGLCAGSGSNPGDPNGEMFMNYMDYVDDNCYNMFTNDQKTRMVTALINSPMRNLLSTPVGISEASAILEGVNVYPNPTKGQLNINVPMLRAGSDLEINIINVLGKTVYHGVKPVSTDGSYKLDLSTLSNGLYILQMKNERGMFTQRVDINK